MDYQEHILLISKDLKVLEFIDQACHLQYIIDCVDNMADAKDILINELSLMLMIVDIDDFPDGFELIRFVRQYPRFMNLSILIIGELYPDIEKQMGLLGIMGHVKKPIEKDEFVDTIQDMHKSQGYHLFERDALTGVYNKEFFLRKAADILQRDIHKDYDLVCFDIDRFKLINDFYGTAEGDRLLCYIAKLFAKVSIDYHWLLGRLHNDVFVILMEHGSMTYEDLTKIVDRQLEAVSKDMKIILSFGIYPITDKSLSVSVMCDRALLASKKAKGNYSTSYTVYQEVLRQTIMDEQSMINEMDAALAMGQFVPFYQPKYNIETGHIIGFEALVRWVHPTRGLIPPQEFIPLFESNGFISQVDYYIWEEVCKDLRKLRDAGYDVLPVSVNVSRMELYLNIESQLLGLMNKYQIPTKLFRLEITETAYTKDPQQLIEVVEILRKRGFLILMDDFGSGYSSLNMLKEVPVDVLKIDLQFVQGIETSGKSEKILESVVIMARKLNLAVIAEGVETKKQVDFLLSIGCLRAQGYYYSHPISREEMYAIYDNPAIYKGDSKDNIEKLINIDDILNHIQHVDDVNWYRSAILKLDAQIFEYDFKTGSMRYYDSHVNQKTGELNKIEVPNYIQRIKEGYHIYPDDLKIALELLSGQEEYKCRLRAKPYFSNQSYQWYEVISRTIYDEYHQPILAVGVLRNVTDEKLNEMVLQSLLAIDAQNALYQTVTQVWANIGKALYFDMVYSVNRMHQPIKCYLHYQLDELIKMPVHMKSLDVHPSQKICDIYYQNQGIIHLTDEYDNFNEWQDYIQGGITDVYCLPIFNKKQYIGDVVFASREKRQLSDHEKAVLIEIGKYIDTYRDIQILAKALQDKNALYNMIMDNIFSAVLLIALNEHKAEAIIANKSFYQLYEIDEKQAIQDIDIMSLLDDSDRTLIENALWQTVHQGQVQIHTYHGIRTDGEVLTLEMRAHYLSRKQESHLVVVTINDISERIKHEKEVALSEIRYRLAFEQTSLRLWDYNIKTKQLYRSAAVQKDAGYEEIIDDVPAFFIKNNIIHPDYQKGYQEFYEKVSQGNDCDYLFKSIHKDGTYKWMHISYRVLFDEQGQPDHAIGIGEDINEVYKNKLKIQQEQYYESLFHHSRIYYDINLSQDSIVFNDERDLFHDISNYTFTGFLEFTVKRLVSPQDAKRFMTEFNIEKLKGLFYKGQTFRSYEFQLGDKQKCWYEIDVNLYTPTNSHDICAFVTVRDIDERKRYELSLEFNVRHDDLTGLYTRRFIREYVEEKARHQKIALLMIDVDDFKLINDTFGHDYGDETLRNIADVLVQVVGEKGIVARIGGDEFVMIIETFDSEQDVMNIAKRINDNIHLSFTVNNECHTLSCSIGIAYSNEHDYTFKSLFNKADQNQYKMKKSHKNNEMN